jgi:hypothetical protein
MGEGGGSPCVCVRVCVCRSHDFEWGSTMDGSRILGVVCAPSKLPVLPPPLPPASVKLGSVPVQLCCLLLQTYESIVAAALQSATVCLTHVMIQGQPCLAGATC